MNATFRGTRSSAGFDRIILGGGIIALGLLLLLQQTGYGPAERILGGWWPIVIVALGISHLASGHKVAFGPVLVTLIGLALLAGTLQLVPGGTFALVWPLVLVAIGLSIVLHRSDGGLHSASDENHLDLSVAFSGINQVSHASRFQSARLNALFGGIVLDLRQARLDPDGATISATATCGGIEVRVPTGWNVEISGTPIFGGYDSKALEDEVPPPDAPRLRIDVVAICGGLSVKH
jgi:hypothetical protein